MRFASHDLHLQRHYIGAMGQTGDREKMRIEITGAEPHRVVMDEITADRMFERAADLAYEAFGMDTSDDHIEWAYRRVVMNWRWGLSAAGAVTVH